VRSIISGPSIQARCLECQPDVPTRIEQKDLTLLALIRSWLG
jgi:protease-4